MQPDGQALLDGHDWSLPELYYSSLPVPVLRSCEKRGLKCIAMDLIFIRDLRIDTVIGIYDWERAIKQTICIDLEMATDIRKAAASDRIEDTLNYKAVAKRIIAFVEDSRFQLVETLAERIAELVREEFDVSWLRLTLNKGGAVRGAQGVGVMIERGNRS